MPSYYTIVYCCIIIPLCVKKNLWVLTAIKSIFIPILIQALPMVTILVGRKTEGDTCRVETLAEGADDPTYTEFPTKSLSPGSPKWANYVKGVVANFPGNCEGVYLGFWIQMRKIRIYIISPGSPKWANYLKGVVANFPGNCEVVCLGFWIQMRKITDLYNQSC